MRAPVFHSFGFFGPTLYFPIDASNITECAAKCTGACLIYMMGSYGVRDSIDPDQCWHLHYIPDPDEIPADCCFYCKRIQGICFSIKEAFRPDVSILNFRKSIGTFLVFIDDYLKYT